MPDEDLRFAPSRTDLRLRTARTELRFPETDTETDQRTDSDPMADYHLVRGDTDDPLLAQCIGSDGEPVSLAEARITLTLTTMSGAVAFESRAEPATDRDEPGWIEYQWRRRETEALAQNHYQVSVTVRWSADRIQTFPNDSDPAIMQVSDR